MSSSEQIPDKAQLLHDALTPLHDPIGINEERVAHFSEAIGLPPAHHIIYSSRNEQVMQYTAKQHGLKVSDDIQRRAAGVFYASYNLALTKNDQGQRVTELTNVHEAAHNRIASPDLPTSFRERFRWKGFKKAVIDGGVISDVAEECFSGFKGEYRGAMTEEMWATMVAGAYNQLILSQDQLCTTNYINAPPEVYPERYEYKEGSSYMYGALALEAICDANPDVLEPMFASRKDHTAMYDVAKEIDKVEKELFLALHNVYLERDKTWDLKSFRGAHDKVLKILGVNPFHKESVNNSLKAIHSRKIVATYVSNLLERYSNQTGYTFAIEPPVKDKTGLYTANPGITTIYGN